MGDGGKNAVSESADRVIWLLDKGASSGFSSLDWRYSPLEEIMQIRESGGLTGEQYEEFRRQVNSLVTKGQNPVLLRRYILECSNLFEEAPSNGAWWACWKRSAIQFFNDEYISLDSVLPGLAEGDLADIDDVIEDIMDLSPLLDSADIPDWVPASHSWWWRLSDGGAYIPDLIEGG
ncbi:hypothetical protein [Nocardiopsis chromatogenes]|uniref:hypothetical protein n=1 Tax=Nocardiopsis chromatogenes TaxID=280239 RepID=UPI00126920FB|nr:hypothetical protein [Nocardiopsis chromatogenes]